MPPEKGSPQDWLIHSESDLQLAADRKITEGLVRNPEPILSLTILSLQL